MLVKRWPTANDLLLAFNPGKQVECASLGDRCYTGMAPTLTEAKKVWGNDIAESWLEIQLYDLSEFAGCKEKMTQAQIVATAQTIILHFSYLKISELMVFFQRLKAGVYGHFYGAVDGMVITEALQSFLRFRAEQVRRIESERERGAAEEMEMARKRMMESGELLTGEEWKEISWLYNIGYERK